MDITEKTSLPPIKFNGLVTTTTRHMTINLAACLNNKAYKLFTHEDGSKATKSEIHKFIIEKITEGYRVWPASGVECEGFDKIKGCPGHPKE
jgi:hypothetical protein